MKNPCRFHAIFLMFRVYGAYSAVRECFSSVAGWVRVKRRATRPRDPMGGAEAPPSGLGSCLWSVVSASLATSGGSCTAPRSSEDRSSRASWRTWSRGSLAPSPRMGKDVVEADVPVGRRLSGPVDRGIGDADLARGYGHFPEVLTQVSGATTRWRNTASRMENPCAAC